MESILSSVSVGSAEGLKFVKILHLLLDNEMEKKANLLRGGELDWIG